MKDTYNHKETIAHHLQDSVLWDFQIGSLSLDITKRVVIMWIISLLLFVIIIPIARRIAKNPYNRPSRLQGLIEVFVNFIRNDVLFACMGNAAKYYTSFFLTLFFFIVFSNLLGLFPPIGEILHTISAILFHGGEISHVHDSREYPLIVKMFPIITATGDFSVTLTLAGFIFCMLFVSGFAFQGIAFIKNIVPRGVPAPLWLVMWPIELVGFIIKPIALSIRLLANMTAGHTLILVLIGFIFQFHSYAVVPLSILGSVAIYLLEIFVAFLQAYIFVFLSALFVSQAQHRH